MENRVHDKNSTKSYGKGEVAAVRFQTVDKEGTIVS